MSHVIEAGEESRKFSETLVRSVIRCNQMTWDEREREREEVLGLARAQGIDVDAADYPDGR